MANETIQLAEYAAGLRFEDLPADVVDAPRTASPTRSRSSFWAARCRGARS